MNIYGLDLGRECGTQGRVCLESSVDLPALIERARFGFLPLQLASRYGMNRLIDGRNCYELIQRGFVIPSRGESKNHEPIRTLEEIYAKDKGGMIFSPQVGLHENVVVLDYENEYANLILRHNLSYETEGHEKGLLPLVLERVLNRRIFFKNLQKSLPVNSKEWKWCEQRIDILKSILVSLYGTSGSFWNRFANVETFEEINRLSREILIRTKDIVQENGFELLYADTDSVFLKKIGAPNEEYENVKDILAREIGIPISVEQYYKFLVSLPLEASERMEALKHYFGITHAGELIARGIEIRRNDAPNFIKEFQTELLYTLFDCKDSTQVVSKGYENALLVITWTIDKIMTGEIQLQDLVVTKKMGQGIDKYKSLFPHVCAAIQLANEGKSTAVGEGIEYIYTDSHHTNPLCRVIPTALVGQTQHIDYDKEKYRDMLLEAAETVLGYFGLDRTAFGDPPKKRMKWWQHLHEKKSQDRNTESIGGMFT
jgi:DNA polymerase elongation subunit (family B)